MLGKAISRRWQAAGAWCVAAALTAGVASGQEVPAKPILALDSGGHTAIVWKLCFTPDGKELISVSNDKTIRFWDVQSGEPLRVLHPPIGSGTDGMLYAAAISPDGQTLAVSGYGRSGGSHPIYLIALPAGQIQRTLTGHTNPIHALAFSPDGRKLASGSGDNSVRLWDVGTGRCEDVLNGHTKPVYGLAFSPEGARLASASLDSTARIWVLPVGQSLVTMKGHTAGIRTVAWSPDGRTIATGSFDQSIQLWNSDGAYQKTFPQSGKMVYSVAFTSDSSGLLYTLGGAIGRASEAVVLDVATGRPRVRFTKHNDEVQHGVLSPDGSLAATTGGNAQETYLWRADNGDVVHRLAGMGCRVFACGWSPDGQSVAWGNTMAYQSDRRRRPLERVFRLGDLQFVAGPDASFHRAITAEGARTLKRTDQYHLAVRRGNQALVTMELHPRVDGDIRSYSFLPNDRAAVGSYFRLLLFDTRDAKRLGELRGHTGGVWDVAPSPDGRFLLSASGDETLRIWSLDKGELLLSLFFAGDEWVVWTPEGYYAASPGGERLMGWHVNNGADKMASFYPAAQFRKSLFRPDLIKLLLRTGSTQRARGLADEARGRASQATSVEHVLPPKVAVTVPDRAAVRITQPTIEIRAQATPAGADPITDMRLLVDGRPYDAEQRTSADSAGSAQASQSWSVRLTPGVHQITVKAATAKSYGLSDPVEVTYEVEQGSQRLPVLYVLAVGISVYEDKSLNLDYGARDAQGLAEAFQKSSGTIFRKVEQKVIGDAQATQRGILRGLEWLKSQMTQHDVGVFFYAGHGAKDANGLFHLVPADCGSSDVTIGGISEDQIKRYCQSIPGRLMLLLDACHTGALGGDKRRGVGGLTDDLLRDLLTDDYGVIVMCSSMGREESQEQESWGHGAFTKALIEGLQGSADFDRDGAVYLNELDLYVTERVKALTGGQQHPVTQKPTTIRSFPLAKPWAGLKPPSTPVR